MATDNQSTALATQGQSAVATTAVPKKDLQQWISGEQFKAAVQMSLPRHLTPERFVRTCLNALMRVPKLAECSQASIFKCMLDLSAVGLEPDGRRAHLIPFNNKVKVPGKPDRLQMECSLIIDYKGLVELMKRSGDVADVSALIVCENDDFEFDRGLVTKHRIDFKRPRGPMYAVYCHITFVNGTHHYEVLTKEEVDKIRARSKAANSGPWVTDYEEMAKKTACRRGSKWVVLSPELQAGIEIDDAEYDKRIRESAVVDLSVFAPSEDPNRGHDATMPSTEAEVYLADEVAKAKAARKAQLEALPDLKELPDCMEAKFGEPVKHKGRFWIPNVNRTAWEEYKADV